MNLGHRTNSLAVVLVAAAMFGGWHPVPVSAAPAGAVPPAPNARPRTPVAVQAVELGELIRSVPARAAQDATLTIKTAPPLPGVRLSLDGTTLVTDGSGMASISQPRSSQMHMLALLDTGIETADKRYAFARWGGQRDPNQAFTPTLDGLSMRGDSTLTAAFSVQQAVTPHFVDQNGQAIDPAQISSATARSDTGALITIAPTGPTWIEGTRVTARANKLELQDASYSWQTLVVSGTNVVDAGKQSFRPATTPDATVVGQFHNLTITGYDALLNHGAGDQAVLTLPDGTVQTAQLDGANTATYQHLPRGTYQARVRAGSSIVGDQEVRLSRDIDLRVPVITTIDVAILAGSVLLVAVGLVLVGRKNIRRRLIAPFRRTAMTTEAETG